MQKRFIFTITIMLGVVLFAGAGFCGDGALEKVKKSGLLTFGAETGMPWIQMDEKTGKLMGFDAEFMIEIGRRLGVEVKMVETNWDALIPALKQKRFDVIMNGMYITDKRLEVIDFGGPVYCYGEAIAIKKGDDKISKDMMQDGTYERILSNYGMPPVECK